MGCSMAVAISSHQYICALAFGFGRSRVTIRSSSIMYSLIVEVGVNVRPINMSTKLRLMGSVQCAPRGSWGCFGPIGAKLCIRRLMNCRFCILCVFLCRECRKCVIL